MPGAPLLASSARSGLSLSFAWYILEIYTIAMPKTDIAKLFQNGRSQAVRLPKDFRFEGDRVRIRRIAQGVLLQPLIPDTARWFAELDHFNSEPFPLKSRRQPPTPKRKIF